MTVLILHGIGGHAGRHWMQWLHDQLEKRGFEVLMPELPDSDKPDNVKWRQTISKLINSHDADKLIIVGHSMGVPAALEIIQDLAEPIAGLVSVAGFYRDYDSELNTKFMSKCLIDIKKARGKISQSFVIYADNDPYVPQGVLQELADGLVVEAIKIHRGGHLNTDAGYTEFPLLVQLINKIKSV
jgi:hypothetical protein